MDYKYLSKSSCNGVSGRSISQTSLKENSIGIYNTYGTTYFTNFHSFVLIHSYIFYNYYSIRLVV